MTGTVTCILVIDLIGVFFYVSYSGLGSSLLSEDPDYKHEQVGT
ncbi:hypothetical protein HU200_052540 [Digitaria exilis]|uniref:Uncharacterized protein n=1 Tax=Digitaria exilis TaxID=1010633 RepID=A0A835E9D3_9POAL|nr:hypothetical protein HU200_052540 [Digitaria exilis]